VRRGRAEERTDLAERSIRKGGLGGRISRRRFLGALSTGAAGITLAGTLGCESTSRPRAFASTGGPGRARAFRTRPDLRPPTIRVYAGSSDAADGYIFVSPKKEPGGRAPSQDAPLILDGSGEPVWFHPLRRDVDAFNFGVQTYGGEPVLTWWMGHHTAYGQGEYVVADHAYNEITRVKAGNGLEGDHHEFLITPEETALLTVYSEVPMDLSSVGGPVDGTLVEGIAQEVDIETGEVLFEWHSLDHVGLEESYFHPSPNPDSPFDYFHINSIDPYPDGYLTISARRTSAVYKVDRATGEVVWRLGGKESDFEMGEGTRTYWQHDARRHPDGRISIFDNATTGEPSRAIVVEVDEVAMKATLIAEYARPDRLLAETQGNVQVLPDGNVFVGWGSEPYFSEFSRDGRLLFDASFPPAVESYRAFRFPWKGEPRTRPAVFAESGGDETTIYASWNGATEVATWQVLAGPKAGKLEPVASAPRKGFETAVTLQTDEPYLAVKAKDGSGNELATSRAVKPQDRASAPTGQKRA
jgi:hypothetical protein